MLATRSARAGCSHHTTREVDDEVERKILVFDVGDKVWIAREKVFGSTMTRALETKWYGPGINTEARHYRFELQAAGNKVTRKAIHARRL